MGKVFLTVGGGHDPLAGGSKSSPGENGQRQQGWEQSVSPFFRNLGRTGIWNVTLKWEPELLVGSKLLWAYLPHPDCLCLQVWLIPRIPAAVF